jgi:hypothetical protein
VLAFLKRRWALLSYAVVLLTCTTLNLGIFTVRDKGSVFYGISDGDIYYTRLDVLYSLSESGAVTNFMRHPPRLGTLPKWQSTSLASIPSFEYSLPLWLPLTAVIGWLVFRELRWREKRAKSN